MFRQASASFQLARVWYFYPPLAEKKLTPPWHGPYLVTQVLDDVRVKIQREPTGAQRVVYIDQLTKYEGQSPLISWLDGKPDRRRPGRRASAPKIAPQQEVTSGSGRDVLRDNQRSIPGSAQDGSDLPGVTPDVSDLPGSTWISTHDQRSIPGPAQDVSDQVSNPEVSSLGLSTQDQRSKPGSAQDVSDQISNSEVSSLELSTHGQRSIPGTAQDVSDQVSNPEVPINNNANPDLPGSTQEVVTHANQESVSDVIQEPQRINLPDPTHWPSPKQPTPPRLPTRKSGPSPPPPQTISRRVPKSTRRLDFLYDIEEL